MPKMPVHIDTKELEELYRSRDERDSLLRYKEIASNLEKEIRELRHFKSSIRSEGVYREFSRFGEVIFMNKNKYTEEQRMIMRKKDEYIERIENRNLLQRIFNTDL